MIEFGNRRNHLLSKMVKEKRDMRPVVLKLGVAVVISLGGILYTFLRTRIIKLSSDSGKQTDSSGVRNDNHVLQRTASPCDSTSIGPEEHEEGCPPKSSTQSLTSGRSNEERDAYLSPEFAELVEDFGFAATKAGCSPCQEVEPLNYDGETPRECSSFQSAGDEQEIRNLRNMVRSLKERERELEFQLLEYYGLKEQQTAFMELQNRLKINNTEAKLFSLKVESLHADKRRLEALVADHEKVSAELDSAKAKIMLLKKKLRSEHERNKEQILALQERVMKLREEEKKAVTADKDIQSILQKLKDLEEERDELRKSNSNLRLENSELAQKLENVQLLATSVLEDEEITALKEESQRLRQENEDLTKEIEQLQVDRCTDLEELVYLRWVNACLRYELRNFQPDPGKTVARDLSRTLSPKSEEKAKKLILEYANKEGLYDKGTSLIDFDSDLWSSSQASYLTDSGEFDDSSMDMTSASRTDVSSKAKVLGKVRRLLRGKDTHHHSRSASVEMTSVEDMVGRYSGASPGCNSGVSARFDARANGRNNRSRSLSQGSRYSLELPRTTDEGYLSIFKSFDSLAEDATLSSQLNRINQDPENVRKSELVKYAEALKGSCKTSVRRRTVSFS